MVTSLLLVVLVMASPFVVYTCVKLGTFAFYRGRQLFEEQQKKGKK